MVNISETIQTIRNTTCIVCGAAFRVPRAGKLYCSGACKQFSYYHKIEISQLQKASRGVNDGIIELNLKEFEKYERLAKEHKEFVKLNMKNNSTYSSLEPVEFARLQNLEKSVPDFAKTLIIRRLSFEAWSFLKQLYPYLNEEDFLKLLDGLDYKFYNNLEHVDLKEKCSKDNPIRFLFIKHVEKLAEGKIKLTT